MRNVLYFLLLVFTVTSCSTNQRGQTPKDILMAFLGPDGIADTETYYAGEMLEHYRDEPTMGQSLFSDVQVKIRPFSKATERSILCFSLTRDGVTTDWYAYLVSEDGQWKMEAVRTLALIGIPAMALEELERKTERTPEEEWELQNLKLMFKTDAELKNYVSSNMKQLDEVVYLQLSGQSEAVQIAVKKLFIDFITVQPDGRIELIIGGMVDNAVGLMCVPKGKSPPPMTPDEYIYVEHVKDGWYVFKTT